jgi:hypothetical protein
VRALGARYRSTDRQFGISSTARARRLQAAQIAGSDAIVGAGSPVVLCAPDSMPIVGWIASPVTIGHGCETLFW